MNAPNGVAVSPDGKSVYVVSAGDDAISFYTRNTSTGTLSYQSCIDDNDTGTEDCTTTINGLTNPNDVVVSSDPAGSSVYVVSSGDDAIVRFDRASTGVLTAQGCFDDGAETCAGAGASANQDGLDGASNVIVDTHPVTGGAGGSVYVTANVDNAVTRFIRGPGGALTFGDCREDNGGGAAACTGTAAAGLDGPYDLAVDTAGKSVYATALDDDSVVRFDRNATTGVLTYQSCIEDDDGPTEAGCPETQGLDAPTGIDVDDDGGTVYVAGQGDDAVASLDRTAATGAIAPYSCVDDADAGSGQDTCNGGTAQGLDSIRAVDSTGGGSSAVRSIYSAAAVDNSVAYFKRGPVPLIESDTDGVPDAQDNCPTVNNLGQQDTTDGPGGPDGVGDACEPNSDGDTHIDDLDNCDSVDNQTQTDTNSDGQGDACEANTDVQQDPLGGDSILDDLDNCDLVGNEDQANSDSPQDNIGDACELDTDEDLVHDDNGPAGPPYPTDHDNCPLDPNGFPGSPGYAELPVPWQDQKDFDVLGSDGVGNACEANSDENEAQPWPLTGDVWWDEVDNCDEFKNESQADADLDGIGNPCEPDNDLDGIIDDLDVCDELPNAFNQLDGDGDGIGDQCEANDDEDALINDKDNCDFDTNPDQADADKDGIGDVCDDPPMPPGKKCGKKKKAGASSVGVVAKKKKCKKKKLRL